MCTFDKEGNITNYKKTMEDLYEDLDQLEEKANADGKATDKEKAEILINKSKAISELSKNFTELQQTKLSIAKEGSRCGLYDKFLGIESNG